MDWLEQSLIDIGLGYKESYDSYVSYGLTARSYTKQKYRKKYYSWLQVGKELKEGVFEEGSFSTWPKRLLKSKTNQIESSRKRSNEIFFCLSHQ